MQVERIGVSKWPMSPDFFLKGSSYPITDAEADRMYRETLQSQAIVNFDSADIKLDNYQYWALILFVFPILTVFGNVLVILSVFRETSLHTATNYFIVSLAGADIGLALIVMPLSGWVEVNNGSWRYGSIFCDIFLMFDVMLCTASILNLAAISIDRYVAVTNPIVYSRHDNNFRVGLTITLAWILSFVIALPIACGLNNASHREENLCVLYNPEYIITSSIGSFYIPCTIMIILYYRVFHAIRARTKCLLAANNPNHASVKSKQIASTLVNPLTEIGHCSAGYTVASVRLKPTCRITTNVSVIEEQTDTDHSLSGVNMDVLSGDVSKPTDLTNGSGEHLTRTENSCVQFYSTIKGSQEIARINGNQNVIMDSDETDTINNDIRQFHDMEHFRKHLRNRIRRAKRCSLSLLPVHYSTVSGQQVYTLNRTSHRPNSNIVNRKMCRKAIGPRLNGFRNRRFLAQSTESHLNGENKSFAHRSSGNRDAVFRTSNSHLTHALSKDRMTIKHERKATKTLAIVLGVFLFCWIPFFTINITHAFCFKYATLNGMPFCHLPRILDSIAVWLGYINSFLNPIIYTIFNMEFRKSFNKLLHCS